MAHRIPFWILFQLVFMYSYAVHGNSETCVKTGPCRCEFENGTAIDLGNANNIYTTNIINPINSTPNGSSWRAIFYYFHPCSNVKISDATGLNECKSSSLCKRNVEFRMTNVSDTYTMNDLGYNDLGPVEKVQFFSGQTGNSIVYTKQESLKTTIVLVCVKESTSLVFVQDDPMQTVLTLYSPYACAFGGSDSHHSAGTTLVIIFLVMATAYLVLGCLVKRFLMGAQGVEVIPNLTFWRDLPNLVKDGIAFITNGFKPPQQAASSPPATSPNPNSYNSI